MAGPDTARIVDLALAAAPAPLSIDTILSWNLARPAELWGLLSAAQAEGRIAQVEPGHFAFGDAARRDEALSAAGAEDWDALLASPERISWALGAANAAAGERRFAAAGAIFRALAAAKLRDAFPDGERGWLAVVVQTLRLARAMYGLPSTLLAEAVAVAVANGDLGAQGLLHGSLAAAALRDGHLEEARTHLARAKDAAAACSGAARAEIHLYLALGLILQGRPREGVECFEELLGDVPDDIGAIVEGSSAAPATGLFVVSLAYAMAGQAPRALDLVHRIRAFAAERNAPAVRHEADLFASVVHQACDEFEASRGHAERAYAFYAGTLTEPVHL